MSRGEGAGEGSRSEVTVRLLDGPKDLKWRDCCQPKDPEKGEERGRTLGVEGQREGSEAETYMFVNLLRHASSGEKGCEIEPVSAEFERRQRREGRRTDDELDDDDDKIESD